MTDCETGSTFLCRSEEGTRRLGARLARCLKPQDVLALIGEIGAGKTTFVQGIARGLGVPRDAVASPSFVLIREYQGRMPLIHADLFRLEKMPEAATVGLEEYYEGAGVTVIEWANRIPGVLPEEFLEVHFDLMGSESRKISLIPHGLRYERRLSKGSKGVRPLGGTLGVKRCRVAK